jgi:hypothetical protein
VEVGKVQIFVFRNIQSIYFRFQNKAKMIGCIFNIDGGYLEGLCRGFKCGILKQSDYLNLVQCETLEGEKMQLSN